MDSKSLAHEGRPRFVDAEFCRELSELTGIELGVLNSVFAGERRSTALDVVKTIVAENLDANLAAWTETGMVWRASESEKFPELAHLGYAFGPGFPLY